MLFSKMDYFNASMLRYGTVYSLFKTVTFLLTVFRFFPWGAPLMNKCFLTFIFNSIWSSLWGETLKKCHHRRNFHKTSYPGASLAEESLWVWTQKVQVFTHQWREHLSYFCVIVVNRNITALHHTYSFKASLSSISHKFDFMQVYISHPP